MILVLGFQKKSVAEGKGVSCLPFFDKVVCFPLPFVFKETFLWLIHQKKLKGRANTITAES